VSNRLGGVPFALKVHPFHREIRRDQEILVRGGSQHSAVVPDASYDPRAGIRRPPQAGLSGQASNLGNQRCLGKRHRPTIPPVICPMVTLDYGSSVMGEWPYAALTGGTQFVTVNQSFTKTFWLEPKFCWRFTLQTVRFQVPAAVLVGKGSKQFPFPSWKRSPNRNQVVRTGILLVEELGLKFRT
jgi:hypothetical protein